MAKDPNELGTIWINEGRGGGAGKLFFGGKVFDIPQSGITVDLLPFEFTDKVTKDVRRGWRVIKATDGEHPLEEVTRNGSSDDLPPF